MVKIRTKYFDDVLDRQILDKFRQVVMLGAGLVTRAVRKPAAGVNYFEIDDAATLKLKQTCYQKEGIHVRAKFIPGNYVTDGLIDLLKRNDFDFGRKHNVLTLGHHGAYPCATQEVREAIPLVF